MQKPIAYVEHPITKKEKFDIVSKGFKILDIRCKPEKLPEGAKVFEKPKKK